MSHLARRDLVCERTALTLTVNAQNHSSCAVAEKGARNLVEGARIQMVLSIVGTQQDVESEMSGGMLGLMVDIRSQES